MPINHSPVHDSRANDRHVTRQCRIVQALNRPVNAKSNSMSDNGLSFTKGEVPIRRNLSP
jgi:hypothetical protein